MTPPGPSEARLPAPAPPDISSPSNPRIRELSRLRNRRDREAAGLTLVDGAREVGRAIAAGADVVEAFHAASPTPSPGLADTLATLARAGVRTTTLSEPAFAKLAFGDRDDGLVAVVRVPPLRLDALDLGSSPLVLVVEGVEKPGNLGAILRTADGAGVDAVVAASPLTDLFNPNAIRASLGTIFSVPLAAAPAAEVRAWLAAGGLRTVAARVDGATPLARADLRGPVAIVLGAESEGLTDAWAGAEVEGVSIPMLGVADSLNVAAAAAVLAYEARRQRDTADTPSGENSRHATRRGSTEGEPGG